MKIFGYQYRVNRSKDTDELEHFGSFFMKRQEIAIANDMCDEQKISTLLHECIEAINAHLQLELGHSQIMGIESGIYQILSDNGIDLSPLLEMK